MLHSNLTKEALSVHILAQFFLKKQAYYGLTFSAQPVHPPRHKIGHFADVLPSQSLGLVLKKLKLKKLEMWANAQRDGRPAEYRWHPLFNAAKFG